MKVEKMESNIIDEESQILLTLGYTEAYTLDLCLNAAIVAVERCEPCTATSLIIKRLRNTKEKLVKALQKQSGN